MNKIYIDITNLILAKFLTGIQRVVRSVCQDFLTNHPGEIVLLNETRRPEVFQVVPVEYFTRRFVQGDADAELPEERETLTLDEIPGGGIFFDVDSVWNCRLKRSALVPELKARGIKWVAYVYDVSPISHPQYASENTVFRFIEYIGTVIRHADAVIVSSEAIAGEFRALCATLGRSCPPVSVSWLGCDFHKPAADGAGAAPDVVAALEGRKYILSVGTIEPRKNHALLLDAFDDALFEKDVSLVFVGRVGWNVGTLMESVVANPKYGRQLFHFTGLDDSTLDWLYGHAFATAMPTHAEGFGLPLVESLLKGVPALVSDIPVMREVGGDYAVYFDNRDASSFTKAVTELLENHDRYAALLRKVATYRGMTWPEVCSRIYDALRAMIPTCRKPLTDVRQLVLLTARFEDAQALLPYIDRFMPFIERVLLLCPDALAARGKELDGGRLRLSFLCDSEILAGEPLPEDHAKRNFFLRCRAMKSDLLDDVFIMSDDDYRPMTTIRKEVFVDESGYKGYYSYDLRKWRGSTSAFVSFDKAVFAELEFLQENGYPTRQYASHMPQIIEKGIFIEMLQAHPGMESKGYLDWDVYFNFLQAKHPDLLEVRPYVAMCWPGATTDWPVYVNPPEYLFENHYPYLYGKGKMFGDIPDALDENYEENCRRKIRLYDERIKRFGNWQRHFADYEKLYEKRSGLRPFFKVRVRDGAIRIHVPEWLSLPADGFVRIPVYLDGPCDGLQISYRMRNAQGDVICDVVKNYGVRIVPEPPVLSLPVFSAHEMASFELYATLGGVEYAASTPLADDRPFQPPPESPSDEEGEQQAATPSGEQS